MDVVIRVVAFSFGIFGVINGLFHLIFPTKTKEFVSKAPTLKFYVVSGCANLLMASLLTYLAVQRMLYLVIVVAIVWAVIGVAELIFPMKFKQWLLSSPIYNVVSACIGLLFASLLIYLAI